MSAPTAQADGAQHAAQELGRPGSSGMEPAGSQADLIEHRAGALQATAAEDAEELLGAVAGEQRAHHDTKHEQCEIHFRSLWSKSG